MACKSPCFCLRSRTQPEPQQTCYILARATFDLAWVDLRSSDCKDFRALRAGEAHQAHREQDIESSDDPQPRVHRLHPVQYHDRGYRDKRGQDAREPVRNAVDGAVLIPNSAMDWRGFHEPVAAALEDIKEGTFGQPHRESVFLCTGTESDEIWLVGDVFALQTPD
jgi:hypothetical protein